MEDVGFSYRRFMASDNNFLGLLDDDNRILVPQSAKDYENAELLIKVKGYQLKCVKYNSDIISYNVMLEPLDVQKGIVYLRKRSRRGRPMFAYEPVVLNEKTEEEKFFYGDCRPILFFGGGHADPYCTFSDMGSDAHQKLTNPVFNALNYYHGAPPSGLKIQEELYTELEKGKQLRVEVRYEEKEVNINLNT